RQATQSSHDRLQVTARTPQAAFLGGSRSVWYRPIPDDGELPGQTHLETKRRAPTAPHAARRIRGPPVRGAAGHARAVGDYAVRSNTKEQRRGSHRLFFGSPHTAAGRPPSNTPARRGRRDPVAADHDAVPAGACAQGRRERIDLVLA